MNRKQSFSFAPWIAAALVAAASTAFAQAGPGPGAGGPGMGGGPMMMQARHGGGMHGGPRMGMQGRMRGNSIDRLLAMGDEINLTDAQRDKLRQIRRASPAALMPKQQAMMEAQMDLRDAMDGEKTDAAALRRAHDKVLKARSDFAAATFDLRVQVREVLTAEQRKKLRDGLRKQGRERMKKQMAPGGQGSGFFDGDEDAGDALDGDEF